MLSIAAITWILVYFVLYCLILLSLLIDITNTTPWVYFLLYDRIIRTTSIKLILSLIDINEFLSTKRGETDPLIPLIDRLIDQEQRHNRSDRLAAATATAAINHSSRPIAAATATATGPSRWIDWTIRGLTLSIRGVMLSIRGWMQQQPFCRVQWIATAIATATGPSRQIDSRSDVQQEQPVLCIESLQ